VAKLPVSSALPPHVFVFFEALRKATSSMKKDGISEEMGVKAKIGSRYCLSYLVTTAATPTAATATAKKKGEKFSK